MIQQTQLKLVDFNCHNLDPINLDVKHNETISISGESGSGKSLLLRAIADLIPHRGECYLENQNCEDIPANEWRKQITYFAAESQWWFDSVGEHFNLPPESQLESQIERYLKFLGFTIDVLDWDVMRCSTGERQRLAIIRLLVNTPSVLLLDEPTANLDSENSQRVENIFKDYQQSTQCSIIWVSHNDAQKKRVSQRQFEILNSKLVEVTV